MLLGQSNWAEGTSYIFIRCALQVQEVDISPDHLPFTEEVWTKINEQIEEFFQGQEIVGWFFSAPQISMEVTDVIHRTHMNSFGGNDKVLFLMEPQEKEEAFFRYENGHMAKQLGYYIYYEKNPMMQEYMVAMNQEGPSEPKDNVTDDAVVTFRSKVRQKQEKKASETQRRMSTAMYAASACLALAVLAVGVNFVNRYDKMQQVTEQAEEASVLPGAEEKSTVTPAVTEDAKNTEKLLQENEEETLNVLRREDAGEEQQSVSPTPAEEENQDTPVQAGEPESEEQTGTEPEQIQQTDGKTYENYTIRPGDTLFKISIQKYGNMDEINEICRLNGISENDIIYPGQTIILPQSVSGQD